MALWAGVDDMDMPGTKGTGWLLEDILKRLAAEGMGTYAPIFRHQLFVHETVPYTSHNSSMCNRVTLSWNEERLAESMSKALITLSQPGSDPGLCICGRPEEKALQKQDDSFEGIEIQGKEIIDLGAVQLEKT